MLFLVCFKQKTAYERRFSDWSSDVCSSDLGDYEYRYLDEIVEEGDRTDEFLRLPEQRPGRFEARSGQPPRHQQVLGSDRAAARRQAEPGKGAEDDLGTSLDAVQDQSDNPAITELIEEFAHDIVLDRKSGVLGQSGEVRVGVGGS